MEDAMATTMVEPFSPWLRELGQVLHDRGTVGAFMPPADLLIDDDGVTVYMDVPGLHPDNLQIELENDTLTISGERPFPYAREEGATGLVQRIERGFGRFQRSIRVPSGLNPDAIEASLHDGVLTLRIPKPETMRPRRIEIKGDTNGSHHEVSAGTGADTSSANS
jgi:HSP20 family protein